MSVEDELIQLAKTVRSAVRSFTNTTPTEDALAAALINYQAAQLIASKLDEIGTRLSDINENIWRRDKSR